MRDQMPVGLLLLSCGLALLLGQLSFESWSPPAAGGVPAPSGSSTWEVVVDPRVWDGPIPLPGAEALQPGGGELVVVTAEGSHTIPPASRTEGNARISFRYARDQIQISGRLYQPHSGRLLFSGPLEADLPAPLYRPESGGVDLAILNLLPRGIDRAVVVDTRGLNLPPELLRGLKEEWKRWEFEPHVSLSEALGPAFCYAVWKGVPVLLVEVRIFDKVERLLEERFPSSVIRTAVRWAQGSRIVGFPGDEDPAWFSRGDFLVATPSGGVDRLAGMLEQRYGTNYSFHENDPLYTELKRLSEKEKGWHLCLIERQPESRLHWAVLLRWTGGSAGSAQGFLVLHVQPE